MTAPSVTSTSINKSVLVVGGGLSGIAAALKLIRAGIRVTLVETRMQLGGRATSFADPTTGQLLDNCQHVLLGCCSNLRDLYEQLGVTDQITWHKRFYFADASGHLDVLEASDLPAPLHMTLSLMKFDSLRWTEKVAIGYGMFRLMRLGKTGRHRWHDRSFSDWLTAHRQPAGAIEKFWAGIAIGALNERLDNMAADYALQVFQEAFCAHEQAGWMGLPAVPLVQLYDAAHQAILQAGGKVLLRTSAQQFIYEPKQHPKHPTDAGRVTGLQLADNTLLQADAYLSTVPFDRLAKLCPPAMVDADSRLQTLGQFQVSPILGIHLWFDQPEVMPLPHVALTQSPLHWIFNKGTDPQTRQQHLHGVISAAFDWVDQSAEAIAQMAAQQVRLIFPQAASARLVHHRVVKEKRATFSLRPGIDACRPGPKGDITNLFTAGDWTNNGWPATMEGAVRSGYLAAGAICNDPDPLVCPLPDRSLYKLIAH